MLLYKMVGFLLFFIERQGRCSKSKKGRMFRFLDRAHGVFFCNCELRLELELGVGGYLLARCLLYSVLGVLVLFYSLYVVLRERRGRGRRAVTSTLPT